MSTVITNAYRLKTNRASTVEKVNTTIRGILSDAVEDNVYYRMANMIVEYKIYLTINSDKPNNMDTFQNFLYFNHFETADNEQKYLNKLANKRVYSSIQFYKLFIEMTTEAARFNLPLKFNHKLTVYFRSLGEYTYYIFTGNSDILSDFRRDFEKLMPSNFETYDYWNNTDGPDDITYASWRGRGRKWDKVFKSRASDEMNKIEIDIQSYHMTSYEKCIKYIPDDYELFKLYYNELKSEGYYSELLKIEGEYSYNKALKGTRKRIEQDFSNGTAMAFYENFEKVCNRDKIIEALCFDKILKTEITETDA